MAMGAFSELTDRPTIHIHSRPYAGPSPLSFQEALPANPQLKAEHTLLRGGILTQSAWLEKHDTLCLRSDRSLIIARLIQSLVTCSRPPVHLLNQK